jgi:DnaK suppressor protein
MDLAKSLVDAETHASLIERAERQLAEIDYALVRLDDGEYGVCLECSEEIPFERLKVIPSALYCVGCQSRDAEQGRSRGA